MTFFNCSTLRVAVLAAVVLFFTGLALQSTLLFAMNTANPVLLAATTVGFYAVLISPVVLITAAVIALLPPVSARLEECRH